MKVRTGLGGAVLAGLMCATPAAATAECVGKPSGQQLTVEITDLRAARGEVAVTVYPDDARKFLAPRGKLARQRVKATTPLTQACFWLPKPGYYAIAVYHDSNADRDFNRTLVGMPDEGFGVSNNAPTLLGIPSFDSVRFHVPAGRSSTRIQMRYRR